MFEGLLIIWIYQRAYVVDKTCTTAILFTGICTSYLYSDRFVGVADFEVTTYLERLIDR
jgi:hypothetical protein